MLGTRKARRALGLGLVVMSALGCDKFYGMNGKRTTPSAAAAEATTGAPAASVAHAPLPSAAPAAHELSAGSEAEPNYMDVADRAGNSAGAASLDGGVASAGSDAQ